MKSPGGQDMLPLPMVPVNVTLTIRYVDKASPALKRVAAAAAQLARGV